MEDLHVHTTFSDGKNTPEEMVQAAIRLGMTGIGFSDHSPTAFDSSYCMPPASVPLYKKTVEELKEKYREKICIRCGIEQDFYSPVPAAGYDYIIGSVHYIRFGEEYVPVDDSRERLLSALPLCNGDVYQLAEKYFETVSRVVEKTGANIIGHFDLISKFNEKDPFFDENHPRYVAAWKKSADALCSYGVPFEVNTGAISRGYKTVPYPAPPIRRYLEEHGAKLIPASDSHRAETLLFLFDQL